MIVGGSLVLVIGALIASDGTVPGWEEAIFHAVNDLPGWLYPILWPGNMLGARSSSRSSPWRPLVVRQYWLALAVVIAGVLKLISERVVKVAVTA